MRVCFFLIVTCGIIVTSCTTKSSELGNAENTYLKFASTVYDYGKVKEGADGSCVFEFRNNSEAPLIINNVRTSCGCAVSEWPTGPVGQNEKGFIKVSYNTFLTGNFRKTITVYSNAENSPVQLIIKGTVLKSPDS